MAANQPGNGSGNGSFHTFASRSIVSYHFLLMIMGPNTTYAAMSGSAVTPLRPIERDILKTLLYFDIFCYPLSVQELYRYLPSDSTTPSEIADACRSQPLGALVREKDGLFCLKTTAAMDPFSLRRDNERRAQRYLAAARVMGFVLRQIPFVRSVMISGELSKGVMSPHGDIDYVVITAPRRVWIARSLCIAFKKIALLNRKKLFCVNHFVAEDHLPVAERNRYTALEIATLRPLYNMNLWRRYLASNDWIATFLPNADLPGETEDRSEHRGLVQRLLEAPLRGTLGDALERRLHGFWKSLWRRRYPDLPEETLAKLYRSEEFISTAYAGDFLTRILGEYTHRLHRYGLESERPTHA